MIAGEAFLGIAGKGFVVGIENMAARLDDVDRDFVSKNFGVLYSTLSVPTRVISVKLDGTYHKSKILVQHIKQLGCKLNTCWPTSTDHKR